MSIREPEPKRTAVARRPRNDFLDNFKALLIICVVVGHFLYFYADEFGVAQWARDAIYLFQMPGFAFISGLLHHRKDVRRYARSLLIPYVVLQVAYFTMYRLNGVAAHYGFLDPFFSLWYLPALFFWKVVTDRIGHLHLRHLFPAAIAAALVMGLVPHANDLLSMQRIVCFYPFFLLGFKLDTQNYLRVMGVRRARVAAAVGLASCFGILLYVSNAATVDLLSCRMAYHCLNDFLVRVLFYPTAIFSVFAIGILVPKHHTRLCFLGIHSIRIYLLHGLFVRYLDRFGQGIVALVDSYGDLMLMVMLVIAFAMLLSLVPVERVFDAVDHALSLPGRLRARSAAPAA